MSWIGFFNCQCLPPDPKEIDSIALDEKLNLPQICLVQICSKYEICKALQPVQRWQWPNLPVFVANSAIATFALVAKLCKFPICNIFLRKVVITIVNLILAVE